MNLCLSSLVVRTKVSARGSGLPRELIESLNSLQPAGLYTVFAITGDYVDLIAVFPNAKIESTLVLNSEKTLFTEARGFFLEVNTERGRGAMYQLTPAWIIEQHPSVPFLELDREEVFFEEVVADSTLNITLAPDEDGRQWAEGYRLVDTVPPVQNNKGFKHYYGVFVKSGIDIRQIMPSVAKDLGYNNEDIGIFD